MSDERKEVSPEEYETIKALLGIDAESFRRTKFGQYILDRALTQEEALIEELIEAAGSCADPKLIKIAMDIAMHRMLPRYIDEAIQSGRAAEQNLESMENEHDY